MRGMMTFNMDDGYLEGILRGFRAGLLTTADYSNLTQCETLEDMKLHLAGSSYGDFLADETGQLMTATIADKCTQKLVEEFNHLRAHAVAPLSKFLDYITYGYMIDNIMLLVTGAIHDRDTKELLSKCHPLGCFETMSSLTTDVSSENGVSDLYRNVIIDTPLAPYFSDYISKEDLDEMRGSAELEKVRNTLAKAYLEDFYRYCTYELGGVTGEVMGGLLEWEADRRAITITLNSMGTELSLDDREKLYPNFGRLVPETTKALAKLDKTDRGDGQSDMDPVKDLMVYHEDYANLFAGVQDDPRGAQSAGGKSLEDMFFEYEIKLCKLSFEQQFHYGVFYAYVKLKEQEIRNIVWIAECIVQNERDKINDFVPIFSN